MTRVMTTFSHAFKNYRPPADLTVSEWAEEYRVLSRENSAEAGPWRNARTPYLVDIMDAFTDPRIRKLSLVASSQVGKALDVMTPIPTPEGWKTMGDLATGDIVFDENGNPCKVIGVTEYQYDRPCYEIEFSDGNRIVADACHKWYVESDTPLDYPAGKHKRATYNGVITTKQIFENYQYQNADKKVRHRYAIPVNQPIQTEEADFILPPYVLGVWLGEGNSASAQVTVAKKDAETIEHLKAEGVTVEVMDKAETTYTVKIEPKKNIHKERYCIRGHDMAVVGRTKKGLCAECARQFSKNYQYGYPIDPVTNKFETGHSKLKALGVLNNKHIPQAYLRGSYAQRLALLQGLMDTDGSIAKNGRCEITLKSKRLIDGVSELLHSLGIKHRVSERLAKCTNTTTSYECSVYRISFLAYSDTPVFRLKRKLDRQVSKDSLGPNGKPRRTTETFRRRIISVTPVPSRPVKCIMVDSPSHLYLAGEAMIPTHNSELELNIIGYIIDQDPGSILYIQPTIDDAKKFSRLRIAPMIRDSKTLRRKVADVKSRDSGNTMLQKSFPGGMLTIVGSNSPSGLASTPAKYVLGDERDRWALSAGTEGDPWALAEARTTTFYNAKLVDVSTPTIKGESPIEKSFMEGTRERWEHQCPGCGEYSNIVFDDIIFDFDTIGSGKKKDYKINSIRWVCPYCGMQYTEAQMRKQPAKWVAENPEALARGHRSFWLNAFSSPWQAWEKVVYSFLVARKDPQRLKVVYNTMLGELWEDRGDLEDEDTLMSRREDYGTRDDGTPIELPEGVLVLTCGVDTQDDRLEGEIVGWGRYHESWGIKKFIIMGDPNDDAPWLRLDGYLDHYYSFANGKSMKIARTFVDSGGNKTQSVYKHCRERFGKGVFAIKGKGGESVPFTRKPSTVDVVLNGRAVAKTYLYTIGVDAGKTSLLYGALKVLEPGPKYCHFPRDESRGYDYTYFTGLLSERQAIKTERGRTKREWVKIPGHERNEPLDCRNYAMAAFASLDPDLEAIERRLKSTKAETRTQETQEASKNKRVKRGVSYHDAW